MGARTRALLVVAAAAAALGACKREERNYQSIAPASDRSTGTPLTELQPGAPLSKPRVKNPSEDRAYDLGEGKTLYSAMNCVGCHAHGGGGMGPALMDDLWRYGSDPDQVFSTIAEGRPNGMPAWGGKLTDDQVWKLVAYVRSLSGLVNKIAAPGRDDHMQMTTPGNSVPEQKPSHTPDGLPPGEGKTEGAAGGAGKK
jgi:cytochrome c oxidase cbb3-type subunit 3